MATTLKATAQFSLKYLYQNVLDIGNAVDNQTITNTEIFTDGEAASQMEGIWRDDRLTAGTTTEDAIDFYGGSITDAFGNVVSAKAIKLLYVENTGTGTITLGGNAAEVPYMAAVNDKIKIPPGGFFAWVAPDAAGIAVTATTGDIISITTGAVANATYRVIVGYTK